MLPEKKSIRKFFASTTLLLVFIAAGLIAYGTHEIETYLYKSNYIEKENIARVGILKPLDGDSQSCSSFLYSYSTTKDIDGNDKLICNHILYEKGSLENF